MIRKIRSGAGVAEGYSINRFDKTTLLTYDLANMTYTSVSTKYQVVIPKEVRERMDIKPGQKFIVWEKGGVIYLIPVIKFKEMEGWFKGMDTSDVREESERT